MTTSAMQSAAERYIDAYNRFDIDSMLAELHERVVFRNCSNDELTCQTEGKAAFRAQAEQAKALFKTREQKILSATERDGKLRIEIRYTGILGSDLPNGWKADQRIEMSGYSIFGFEDGKIISLDDVA
ncbi:MAG: hypothetical protein HY22_07650 [[Candidatus Thermochlorobacteriaceae] bacterium GBChlB]|nr:MAG: hypothetical protein HY22_07650 [[Candidatus Thermochlorobacteriaceae] bacterium GBChlB]